MADRIRERVLALSGVLDLDGGVFGEFSTYGGGRRARGVLVRAGEAPRVTVRLVAALGSPLPALADRVRDRVAEVLPSARVDVAVTDVRESEPERADADGATA